MIDCGDFDMSFSRFCTDSHLTEKQLISSMESLGIDKNTLEDFPFDMYLRWFYEMGKGYSLKKLVCLGILLGKGTAERKGELLLQNYDRDCSGEIDIDEFNSMMSDMILISVDAAIDLAKKNDGIMINPLDAYIKKLKAAQKVFVIYVHFIMSNIRIYMQQWSHLIFIVKTNKLSMALYSLV